MKAPLRFTVAVQVAALCSALVSMVLLAASKTLDIYFIDTEGGQATLLVSPSGETFMIDVGFAGLDTPNPDKDVGRDAARIADVAKMAKVARIDTLLVTHFHGDHASGMSHLTIPVRTFVDHGPALQDAPTMKQKVGEYAEDWSAAFAKGKHVVVAPGDRIPVKGLEVTVVEALGKPVARSGAANQYCGGIPKRPDGNPEDTASVGVVVQYGRFRFANFGDLPWNQEVALLCPRNRVGTIDVYEAAGHGREPTPAAFAMHPRIAVLDNGARKGGGAATLQGFRKSPGFEDLWQLHKNVMGGVEGNPADAFSANLEDTDNTMHPAHYLKISATDDGSFTAFNSRTNETKRYAARKPGSRSNQTR
jgi:beta-lactamase superfamily II metal-dependent hydrolase